MPKTALHVFAHDAESTDDVVGTGGHRVDRPGAFVEPTVLTWVAEQMRAYSEERRRRRERLRP